ncbi:MAG: ABC transporter permease [Gemmatimonadetes bacterium]|nr:ABC transporter permease [Gemmatimonadota bacterium]
MNELLKDLRYGARMLYKTPGVSLVAIVTMAIGIGAVTYQFSSFYALTIRGLPFEDGDRLVRISQTIVADGVTGRSVPIHDFVDWREQQTVFEDLAGFYFSSINLGDEDQRPERYFGTFVTANMFSEVNTQPLMGRVFRGDEDRGHTPPTIVLGHSVWQARYGGDPDVIGKVVRANGLPAVVIGVMPEGFRFPFENDLWMPLAIDHTALRRGQGPRLWVIGRLKKDVSLEQAQVQITGISQRLAVEYPATNDGVGAAIRFYADVFLPPEFSTLFSVGFAAAFGVLIIACANLANLLLARAAVRVKEMAIRTALGASRARVIRQLMVEAAMMALIGGIAGVILATLLIDTLETATEFIRKPYWYDIRTDPPVLIFAIVMTLVASFAAGIVPALKASGIDVHEVLKDESAGSSSFRMGRFSTSLVIGEIAVSCAMLVAAGMAIKSVINFRNLDMGFQTANMLTGRVTLDEADYPDSESRLQFFDDLHQRLGALVGVESVAFVDRLPGTGAYEARFGVEGGSYVTDQDYPNANRATISLGFFRTFGVKLLEGRDFTSQDRAEGLPVVIINQSFAQRYFPRASAVGKRFRLGRSESRRRWMTVVGVVPDLHVGEGDLGGLRIGSVTPEQFYTPLAQGPPSAMRMAIETRGDPLAIAPVVRDAVAALDPNLPIYEVDSMEGAIESATWMFGILSWTFSVFGAMALLMSAIGLYAVMAFSVNRRTQEMGIRIALGACDKDIVGLVLKKGMTQIGIGMAIGLALGVALTRPLQVLSFRVNPHDPAVYAAIIVTLALTGLLACLVPAHRATRVNLVAALKAE